MDETTMRVATFGIAAWGTVLSTLLGLKTQSGLGTDCFASAYAI